MIHLKIKLTWHFQEEFLPLFKKIQPNATGNWLDMLFKSRTDVDKFQSFLEAI